MPSESFGIKQKRGESLAEAPYRYLMVLIRLKLQGTCEQVSTLPLLPAISLRLFDILSN